MTVNLSCQPDAAGCRVYMGRKRLFRRTGLLCRGQVPPGRRDLLVWTPSRRCGRMIAVEGSESAIAPARAKTAGNLMEPEPPQPAAPPAPPPLGPLQFTLRSLMLAGTVLAVCLSAIKTLDLSLAYIAPAVAISLAVLVCRSRWDPLKILLLAAIPSLLLAVLAGWRFVSSGAFPGGGQSTLEIVLPWPTGSRARNSASYDEGLRATLQTDADGYTRAVVRFFPAVSSPSR